MTVAPNKPKVYTEEEYLALEVESDIRSEYRDGEIIPMTGGTPEHNRIAVKLVALLTFALEDKPYVAFAMDQRLWIPQANNHTYPDVMVLPEPVSLEPGRKDTVIEPFFIAEVLSSPTKNYDRGDKFAMYRTIQTLQEYVLVDQYKVCVERYQKQAENQWLLTEYKSSNDKIALSSVPVKLTIRDLYKGVLAE